MQETARNLSDCDGHPRCCGVPIKELELVRWLTGAKGGQRAFSTIFVHLGRYVSVGHEHLGTKSVPIASLRGKTSGSESDV